MHIADGVASVPVLAGGVAIAAAGVAVGLARMKDEQIPKAALLAAVIFVGASVVRLPVGPSSAHPLLNGLAGLVLGWTAVPVFLVVLFLQTLLFQFGGITTLGVNLVTMAAPAVVCHYCFGTWVRRAQGGRSAFALGAGAGGVASVLSFGCWMTALVLSGKGLLPVVKVIALPQLVMVGIEAAFTGFAVSFLWKVYPRIFDMTGFGNRRQGTGVRIQDSGGDVAVSIADLDFGYERGDFRLHVPELTIPVGARAAITGPSGCGKTTLANLISGICVPRSGSVTVCGSPVSGLDDGERRNFRISNVGFIFQEFELLDYLRTEENILLPYLVNHSLELTPQVRATARELAESVGLAHMLKRSPRELSQGERQRVAICRALITQPRLLIADEPTGSLDDDNRRVIMDLVYEQLKGRDTTFLMITHERELLDEFDCVIDVPALGRRRPS